MKINAGSGQRPFDKPWVNVDINPKWNPDVCCSMDAMPFDAGSASIIVSHHTIEHMGCDGADGFIAECKRLLRPGGSLLIFVPDMEALAKAWLAKQIPDQIYFTNVYGAYMGDEADRHRFGYSFASLGNYLGRTGWSMIKRFDWRKIEGAHIAHDWWILGMECIR